MITIKVFTFNAFSENTVVLSDPKTKECIIIDAGCYTSGEQNELKNYIDQNGLKPKEVINTHCHIDHVLGNQFVKDAFGIPLRIPTKEQEVFASVSSYSAAYGFGDYRSAIIDGFIEDDEVITLGNNKLQTLFVPGHSPGHLAFYCKEQGFCINGDVLFNRSVGRTDLPGGNHETLLSSIRNVMFMLSDETEIYCGHGENTSIGFEKMNNPFLGEL